MHAGSYITQIKSKLYGINHNFIKVSAICYSNFEIGGKQLQ